MTHQFFISSQSVFLIVFNLVDFQMDAIQYWWDSIVLCHANQSKSVQAKPLTFLVKYSYRLFLYNWLTIDEGGNKEGWPKVHRGIFEECGEPTHQDRQVCSLSGCELPTASHHHVATQGYCGNRRGMQISGDNHSQELQECSDVPQRNSIATPSDHHGCANRYHRKGTFLI